MEYLDTCDEMVVKATSKLVFSLLTSDSHIASSTIAMLQASFSQSTVDAFVCSLSKSYLGNPIALISSNRELRDLQLLRTPSIV